MRPQTIPISSLLGFLLFAATIGATTPTVTTISSSSQVQGNIVTITGVHLQDTDPNGLKMPPSQGGFEGASFEADGWSEKYPSDKAEIDNSVRIVGNQSFRNWIHNFQPEQLDGGKFGCPNYYYGGLLQRFYPGEAWNAFYFRYYVRYSKDFVWPDNYMKQLYMGDGWCMNPLMGATGYGIGQPNVAYFGFPKPLQEDRWYCIEGETHHDGSQGELWLDGQSMGKGSPGPGSKPWNYFSLGTVNSGCFSATPQASSSIWFDQFNFSTTRRVNPEALVYLANSPSFATATKVCQELLSISDNSIKFRTDYGGLGYGPLFLFVVNNKNEVSAPFSAGTGKQWDYTVPTVSSMTPANGQAGLPPYITVKLSISDLESGVNKSSISMKVNGQTVTPSMVTNSTGYALTYKPAVNFDSGSTVRVVVDAKDLADNAMPTFSYSFTIRGTVGITFGRETVGFVSASVGTAAFANRLTITPAQSGPYRIYAHDASGRLAWEHNGKGIGGRPQALNWRNAGKPGVYVLTLEQSGNRISNRLLLVR